MDPAISLRPYREDDEDAVTALWNSVFPGATPWNEPRVIIAKKLALQRELFFVAVSEEAVVGTAMGGFDGHRGWLYTVAVRPDKQRRAIGSALVRRIENALTALGCPKLNLQVRPRTSERSRSTNPSVTRSRSESAWANAWAGERFSPSRAQSSVRLRYGYLLGLGLLPMESRLHEYQRTASHTVSFRAEF